MHKLRVWGRFILRGVAVMMACWLVLGGMLLGGIIWYGYQDHAQPTDVIVILGGGLQADDSLTRSARGRVERGVQVWQEGHAQWVVCSGGVLGDHKRSEAQACAEALEQSGVPTHAILLEASSWNTDTNARFTHEMLQAYGVQRITLVTTRYHMLRAYWMFNRQGLQVDTRPAPLDYLTRQEILYAYTREVLAFQWQFLRDRFPLPFIYVPVP